MLCNDDEYPNRFLSLFANLPPAFHGLGEFRVVQRAWLDDEEALSHFKPHLVEPPVAREFLSRMSAKQERRILESLATNCYYPLLGESVSSLREKPEVTVQVATETPQNQITLSFNVERSKVAQEINKMLKNLHKVSVPKMSQAGRGEV